jgi:alkylation response protein AidB-like acyl-CoA dehydrogenase
MSAPVADQVPLADAADLGQLRRQVRGFLAAQRSAGAFEPRCDSWLSAYSEEFSRALGAAGWLGMTWPRKYGGHERSEVERYTVTKDMASGRSHATRLRARECGAPVLGGGFDEPVRRHLQHGTARA